MYVLFPVSGVSCQVRSLRRAIPSSIGVLPIVVCPISVIARTRKVVAMTQNRVEMPDKKNISFVCAHCLTPPLLYVPHNLLHAERRAYCILLVLPYKLLRIETGDEHL
jgi:hypothetical protein